MFLGALVGVVSQSLKALGQSRLPRGTRAYYSNAHWPSQVQRTSEVRCTSKLTFIDKGQVESVEGCDSTSPHTIGGSSIEHLAAIVAFGGK